VGRVAALPSSPGTGSHGPGVSGGARGPPGGHAGVVNWTSFPHPTWFIVGQLVGYPLALLAAVRLLGGESTEEPQAVA